MWSGHHIEVLLRNYNRAIRPKMRFGCNFWLEGPIVLGPTRLNCILRDTPLAIVSSCLPVFLFILSSCQCVVEDANKSTTCEHVNIMWRFWNSSFKCKKESKKWKKMSTSIPASSRHVLLSLHHHVFLTFWHLIYTCWIILSYFVFSCWSCYGVACFLIHQVCLYIRKYLIGCSMFEQHLPLTETLWFLLQAKECLAIVVLACLQNDDFSVILPTFEPPQTWKWL